MEFIAKFWAPIWAIVTTIAVGAMAWLSRTYAHRDDLLDVKRDVEQIQERLDRLPSDTDLHMLKLEISELRGDLKEVRPELRQLRRLSDLLLENELKDRP